MFRLCLSASPVLACPIFAPPPPPCRTQVTPLTPFPLSLAPPFSPCSQFKGAASFNGDVSRFDTSGVCCLGSMFLNAGAFKGIGIESWNVSSLAAMGKAFDGTSFPSCTKRTIFDRWGGLPAFTSASYATWKDDVCTECLAGTKRESNGGKGCAPCPIGKYSVDGNTLETCKACAAGMFAAATGVYQVGRGECQNCTKGRFQASAGQGSCNMCDQNLEYQSLVGQASCSECADFTQPTSGRDACLCVNPCPAGTYV